MKSYIVSHPVLIFIFLWLHYRIALNILVLSYFFPHKHEFILHIGRVGHTSYPQYHISFSLVQRASLGLVYLTPSKPSVTGQLFMDFSMMLLSVVSKRLADMHEFTSATPLWGRAAFLILFECGIEMSHWVLLMRNMIQGPVSDQKKSKEFLC